MRSMCEPHRQNDATDSHVVARLDYAQDVGDFPGDASGRTRFLLPELSVQIQAPVGRVAVPSRRWRRCHSAEWPSTGRGDITPWCGRAGTGEFSYAASWRGATSVDSPVEWLNRGYHGRR
jgi:hypothetical protein